MKYTVECLRCGKQYESGLNRNGYCPECKMERQKERNAKYQERKFQHSARAIGSADICQKCGKPYIVKSGSQVLCQDCIAAGVKLTRSKVVTASRNKLYDSIQIYVPKGQKQVLKEFVQQHNMSMNEFVNLGISLALEKLK